MSKQKNCELYIDGMHCASCEILIEKKLLKEDGIKGVDASLKSKKVHIEYDGKKPSIKKLNNDFSDLGYKFSTKKFTSEGELGIDQKKRKNIVLYLFSILAIVIFYFLFEELSLGKYMNVTETSAIPAFFLLGIVAGVSSCAALIGGLLLSMVKQWNEIYIDSESIHEKAQPHILFHSGRIIGFGIFGGFLGLLGDAISLDNPIIFAILTIIVSIFMILIALQMLGVEWAQRFQFTTPKFLSRYIANEENFSGRVMPFLLGILTFFLPCGFTLLAQSLALASGSIITGAVIMVFFALGTFIPLLLISITGLGLNTKPHLTAKFNIVAGLVIIFFAIYNINSQMNLLNLPSLSDGYNILVGNTQLNEDYTLAKYNSDGIQEIQVTTRGSDYILRSENAFRAGESAVINVTNLGADGCAVAMAATGLIKDYVLLEPGKNIINIENPQKGNYKLTCTMGMVDPVIIKVI